MRAIAGLCLPGAVIPPENCCTILSALSAEPAILRQAAAGVVLGASDYRPASMSGVEAQDCRNDSTTSRRIVADLRIDNHDELTRELGLAHAACDDEVLAHAWTRWGFDIVDHLIGGFAFALWDEQRQTLFLARDHAGERPLHFARQIGPGGAFAFASMPQGLCALPSIGCRINMERMAHHLAILPLGNETFFEGIERLPPAHWIKVSRGAIEIRRYWHPIETRPIRYAQDADYIEEFRDRFDRAVGARLEGNEGIASQLSGGLDSSSVTATAARLLMAKGGRLTSFTAVPLPDYAGAALPGRFGDEGPVAAQVAALYPNIDHVRVHVAGRDPLACWRRDARLTGQPSFNPTNMLWIEAILEEMRSRGLGVVLHGATGNATISFGGLIALSDLLRRGHWWRLFQLTRELRSGGHTSWRGAASWASGWVVPQWLRRLYHPEMRDFSFSFSAVRPEIASEYRLREKALAEFYGAETSTTAVRRDLYEFYDPGVSNAAVAAGWGIEQRDPTQDKRIFEFCFGIPVEQYLVGGQSRSLIRRAMQGRLPESTLRCTTRGLQSADWYLTVRAALPQLSAELNRIERSPLAHHVLDVARLRTLLDTFPSTGYDTHEVSNAWHLALTRGIAAGSFLAGHDPDMPRDEYAAAATEKPGAVPSF
jgi:asparagine synthase (glutamine-hydrolysing)